MTTGSESARPDEPPRCGCLELIGPHDIRARDPFAPTWLARGWIDDPCMRRVAEAELDGRADPDPLCPEPSCPHRQFDADHMRESWDTWTDFQKLKSRIEVERRAAPDHDTFPPAHWRTLSAADRLARIDHVLSLLGAAENDGRDPPSWRKLAREAGASVKTLKGHAQIVEAFADAERGAAASAADRLRRSSITSSGERRTA